MSPNRSTLIALDADGVLLDYNLAYARAWERAFGIYPALRDPQSYWPIDRWAVERLAGERLDCFRAAFDESFWEAVPAMEGAVDACQRLVNGGYSLVCVTALEPRYAEARARNLRALGFPINEVVATSKLEHDRSPKAETLGRLNPVAFVDDFLPYHRGVGPSVHKALILREPKGSPNMGEELEIVDSKHQDLSAFVTWWLDRPALRP